MRRFQCDLHNYSYADWWNRRILYFSFESKIYFRIMDYVLRAFHPFSHIGSRVYNLRQPFKYEA